MAAPVVDPEPRFIRDREPTTNFFSETDVNLTQVPEVEEIEDPILYRELLKLHNSIEALLIQSDRNQEDTQKVIDKGIRRTLIDEDYTATVDDGTIRVDASNQDITVTLHPVADALGSKIDVKRIDNTPANKVTLVGDGSELIDDRANGINISTKSSYTVKSHSTGWDIL